jgi:hypothetical protein
MRTATTHVFDLWRSTDSLSRDEILISALPLHLFDLRIERLGEALSCTSPCSDVSPYQDTDASPSTVPNNVD